MNKSESIKELAAALTAAQSEMPAVPMNSINPFLKNRYADLGAMIETARPVLSRHGLSITQLVTNDGGNIGIETVLMHASGEWVSSVVTMFIGDEKGKSLAQVAGSTITYMRRYSYSAILCLYADEDTDGHSAQKSAKSAVREPEGEPGELPQTAKPGQKTATVANDAGAKWNTFCDSLAKRYPHYAKAGGEPDRFHIGALAVKFGVGMVTLDNLPALTGKIEGYAKENHSPVAA